VGPLLDNTELYLAEEFIQSSIIFEKTPLLFQTRVYRAVYLEALSNFALTSTLSEKCRHALCCIIKIEVACADEVLSEVGDVQTQLYLILRGSVLVSDPNKRIEYGLLKRGGFFGELVMMFDEHLARCRAPHLKAKENCCFATISRAQLQIVLREFPDDAIILDKIAVCRARIFKHNSLPTLDAHESNALFLMNVISTIAPSSPQTGSIPSLRESESSNWSRKMRTPHRPSYPMYERQLQHAM
jgi:CRP-like cAMP-binding protein